MPGHTPRSEPRWEVRQVRPDDPSVEPLLAGLMVEYSGRYPEWGGGADLDREPTTDWDPPDGAYIVILEDGETVAGGAFRRADATTAEFKRIWTSSAHRGRGLARRVLAELEQLAATRGYQRVYLTIGPRQPEARQLYLASGYTPLFDVDEHPTPFRNLPFEKALVAAP